MLGMPIASAAISAFWRALVQTPPDPDPPVDVIYVSPSCTVNFDGGTNRVAFDGGTNRVDF